MSEVLVEVKHLKQYFSVKTGLFRNTPLKAVDDVSFIINKGETLGLVGESGCGKTTVGRSMLNLYTPTGGEVFFKGEKVDSNSIKHLCREMQMVFQDPYSSLNPRMTVADIIGEPLDIHHMCATKDERKKRITEIMELVGLNSEHARRYAHLTRASLSVTNLFRRLMFPFRRRLSICSRIYRQNSGFLIFLLRMIFMLSTT
jgi:oligopeptide transport system ATP-binding protein